MEPQISGRAVGPEGSSPAVRTRDSPDPAGNRGRLMIFISDLEEIWSERPRPGLQNAADPAKRGPLERWPSGLRRTLGKRVCGKPYRGFESHSLRHQVRRSNASSGNGSRNSHPALKSTAHITSAAIGAVPGKVSQIVVPRFSSE